MISRVASVPQRKLHDNAWRDRRIPDLVRTRASPSFSSGTPATSVLQIISKMLAMSGMTRSSCGYRRQLLWYALASGKLSRNNIVGVRKTTSCRHSVQLLDARNRTSKIHNTPRLGLPLNPTSLCVALAAPTASFARCVGIDLA